MQKTSYEWKRNDEIVQYPLVSSVYMNDTDQAILVSDVPYKKDLDFNLDGQKFYIGVNNTTLISKYWRSVEVFDVFLTTNPRLAHR